MTDPRTSAVQRQYMEHTLVLERKATAAITKLADMLDVPVRMDAESTQYHIGMEVMRRKILADLKSLMA